MTTDRVISRDDVVLAYELMLGREPESDEVIDAKLSSCQSISELRREFISAGEFRSAVATVAPNVPVGGPPIRVDLNVDEATQEEIFARVQQTWTKLGEVEPYWSVLSVNEFKRENFTTHEKSFFESGRNEVDVFLSYLKRNGIELGRLSSCLELGCGVGRVTRWLAEHFNEMVACDVSSAHVEIAGRHLAEQGVHNVEFKVLRNIRDIADIGKFDALFSIIVLQHNPPPVIAFLVEHLLQALNPAGIAFLQVPTYSLGYEFDVYAYLNREFEPGQSGIEMHVLPQRQLFALIDEADCSVLEIREDNWVGIPGWVSNSVLVQKNA